MATRCGIEIGTNRYSPRCDLHFGKHLYWTAIWNWYSCDGEQSYRHTIWHEDGKCLRCGATFRDINNGLVRCARKSITLTKPCAICSRETGIVEGNTHGLLMHSPEFGYACFECSVRD